MCLGASSGRRLPTALIPMMCVTPSILSAQMFACDGSSLGLIAWPRPWRGRKASRTPPRVPVTISSLGRPKGVSGQHVSIPVSPWMAYMPLPPMTPIRVSLMLPSPLSVRHIVVPASALNNPTASRAGTGHAKRPLRFRPRLRLRAGPSSGILAGVGDERSRQGGLVSGCKPRCLNLVNPGQTIKCQHKHYSGIRSRRVTTAE
jgi:hypothetical protein